MKAKRVTVPLVEPIVNRNIGRQYSIQGAAWIWHPEARHTAPVVVRFEKSITLVQEETIRVHLSADQRFELFVDGERTGMGPDRCDLLHWSFHTYDLALEAGDHSIEVLAWYLDEEMRPQAQVTLQPGFIFHADGWESDLSTGRAAWRASIVGGISYEDARQLAMPGLLCVGPSFTIDAREEPAVPDWVESVIVHPPIHVPQLWGVSDTGWSLLPSQIPEQTFQRFSGGTVRAVRSGEPFDSTRPFDVSDESAEAKAVWQAVLDGTGSVTVPAGDQIEVIVDLDDYLCAYAMPTLSGGGGGELRVEWAETLYDRLETPVDKGDRAVVSGKRFLGFHDAFIHAGGAARAYRSLWWRCGRYLRLWAVANADDLVIESLPLYESRYPLQDDGQFESDDPAFERIRQVGSRGVQSSLHETYTDSPYYEQMMYVGDTRLEVLVTYLMTAETTPAAMAIEWFNRSRYRDGFVAERYPTGRYQHCLPFSMIWIMMVRDFALYRDEPTSLRRWITGVRQSLEAFRELLTSDSLLSAIPGWPWFDWPNEWSQGVPPGGRDSASAPINLLFANALLAAADLEEWAGEHSLAERNRALAAAVTKAVLDLFWDETHGLIADDRAHSAYSEHSQALAILTGLVDPVRSAKILHALEVSVLRADAQERGGRAPDSSLPHIVRTTVYFCFYMHEVFCKLGRHDLYEIELRRWRKLIDLDLKTPVEDDCRPGSRSDCHAWGAHPVRFFHSWYAGIAPASPGFKTVRVAPDPGSLRRIACVTPHPQGAIRVDLSFDGGSVSGTVRMPPDIPGIFEWNGHAIELIPGEPTQVRLG